MSDFLGKIVYMTEAQYLELMNNGSVTVNGVTVQYNENDLYITPATD